MATAESFHPAVQLILARMASNPEEFINDTKWERLLNGCIAHGTTEEEAAIREALRLLNLEAIHRDLMRTLVGDTEEDDEDIDVSYKVSHKGAIPVPSRQVHTNVGGGGAGGLMGGASLGSLGGYYDANNLLNNQTEAMRRAVDENRLSAAASSYIQQQRMEEQYRLKAEMEEKRQHMLLQQQMQQVYARASTPPMLAGTAENSLANMPTDAENLEGLVPGMLTPKKGWFR